MSFFISFLFGLVAEVATGLVIGAGMFATRGGGMPANPADLPLWVPIVAMVAGSAFTFLIGRWRASRQPDRALAHGIVVAVGAIVLHLATSVGAGQPFTPLHAIADALKLVAGAVAGTLARTRSDVPT